MRNSIKVSLWLFLFAAMLPTGAHAFQVHQDTTYGYRITPPDDWVAPARDSLSQGEIGYFISKKATYYNSPEGWTWSFKPEMKVVAFVHKAIKGGSVKTEEVEDGEGKKISTITLKSMYKNYKDYLKRSYHSGGYYFSAEKEFSVKGIPVTCYEIKVEKLARTGPRRIITWVYHLKDLDIAVQVEILEKSYSKLRSDILRCLKSFRTIERTGDPVADSEVEVVSRIGWDKLNPAERSSRRLELETKAHEKALKELPKGWRHAKVGRILVLDNYSPKLAKEAAMQCQAIFRWLDKKFAFIGPDEYVRAPILKVFKTDDPNSAVFRSGGFLDNIVIEYEHTTGLFSEMNYEKVNRRVLELWFTDRNRDLYWAMPYWVKNGLDDLIENARAKGPRLEFPKDVHDNVRLNQALSKGQLSEPRELMIMGREKFYSGRWKSDEASALVRYFLIGPGSKNRKTKNIFNDYLKNLAQVTADIKKEEREKKQEDKPTTEEEEEEYFKQEQNAWKDKEKRVLEETFNRTFAGWTDKDWKAVKASYMRMVDG